MNLRVFRHRGFRTAVITISLTFGAFFSSIVLVPLWLQTNMGYTAAWAGYVAAWGGVLAVVMSPIVPKLMQRFDLRALVSFGVLWLGVVSLVRAGLNSNATYWDISLPFIAQGVAMPFFFIPTTALALSSVQPQETASAAGLSNFMRTLSAAFATAIVTTLWENNGNRNHEKLASTLPNPESTITTIMNSGSSRDQALNQLDALTSSQAIMLATDEMFRITAVVFVIAALVIWLAPKTKITGNPMGGGGH